MESLESRIMKSGAQALLEAAQTLQKEDIEKLKREAQVIIHGLGEIEKKERKKRNNRASRDKLKKAKLNVEEEERAAVEVSGDGSGVLCEKCGVVIEVIEVIEVEKELEIDREVEEEVGMMGDDGNYGCDLPVDDDYITLEGVKGMMEEAENTSARRILNSPPRAAPVSHSRISIQDIMERDVLVIKVILERVGLFNLKKKRGTFEVIIVGDGCYQLDISNPQSSLIACQTPAGPVMVKVVSTDASYKLVLSPKAQVSYNRDKRPVDYHVLRKDCVESEVGFMERFSGLGITPTFYGYTSYEDGLHFLASEDISEKYEPIGMWARVMSNLKLHDSAIIFSRILHLLPLMTKFHGCGYIHGDLHSNNMFFSKNIYDPKVYLIDFGRTVYVGNHTNEGWSHDQICLLKYIDILMFCYTLWKSFIRHAENMQNTGTCFRQFDLTMQVTAIIFNYLHETFEVGGDDGFRDTQRGRASNEVMKVIREIKFRFKINCSNMDSCKTMSSQVSFVKFFEKELTNIVWQGYYFPVYPHPSISRRVVSLRRGGGGGQQSPGGGEVIVYVSFLRYVQHSYLEEDFVQYNTTIDIPLQRELTMNRPTRKSTR